MGSALEEDFSLAGNTQNRMFITPRLWGIADSGPYMHDGRTFTLAEAIALHGDPGSEANQAAQNFAALSDTEKNQLLAFLLSLRTPKHPAKDLLSAGE